MEHTIYAYTTETYLKYRGWFKIGDTFRDVKVRVEEQGREAAVPEVLQVRKTWSVGNFRDYDLHKILRNRGVRVVNKRGKVVFKDDNPKKFKIDATEWYDFGTTDEATIIRTIDSAINEMLIGVSRPKNFPPRSEQTECVERQFHVFKRGGKYFLVAGKQRVGKVHISYLTMLKLKARRTLILSYKTQVDAEWESGLNDHVAFNGYKFYHARKDFSKLNPIVVDTNSPWVLWASMQDILGEKFEGGEKEKWTAMLRFIKKNGIDFVIVDEAHFGFLTTRSQKLFKELEKVCEYISLLSATPINLLMDGRFDDENTWFWTYPQEQKKKRADVKINGDQSWYRWLPELWMATIIASEYVKKDAQMYDETGQFSLNKFFGADSNTNEFINASAVYAFLTWLRHPDNKICPTPFNHNDMCKVLNHLFWILPGVASCRAMRAMLESHPSWKDYTVIPAYDNNDGEGMDTLGNVKGEILQSAKTITLSCGKLNTGVTVNGWRGIVYMSETQSPQTYWQTNFRGGSMDKENRKEYWVVIDLNPNRALRMINTYCQLTASRENSTAEARREFHETVKFLAYQENTLRQWSADEFDKKVVEAIDIAESMKEFQSTGMVHDIDLSDASVVSILNKVSPEKNTHRGPDSEISKNDLPHGPSFQCRKNKTVRVTSIDDVKEQEKMRAEAIRRVLRVLKMIQTFLYITPGISTLKKLVLSTEVERFSETVGISMAEFKELLEKKVIHRSHLDRAIEKFNAAIS